MTVAMKVCLCGVMARHTMGQCIATGIQVNPMTVLVKTVLSCMAHDGMMTAARRSTVTSVKDQKVRLFSEQVTCNFTVKKILGSLLSPLQLNNLYAQHVLP